MGENKENGDLLDKISKNFLSRLPKLLTPKKPTKHESMSTKIFNHPARLFVVLALIFGLTLAIINPPFFGIDERAHYLRAYQIAQGDVLPTTVGKDHQPGAYLPTNLTRLVNTSTANLTDTITNPRTNLINRKYAELSKYSVYYHSYFSTQKINDYVSDDQLSGTFSYNPVAYSGLALGVKVGEIFRLPILYNMYLTRIFGLLTFIVIVYYAIKLAPRYKWFIVAIALLPVTLFQASTISIDGVMCAVAFLLFGLLIKVWDNGMKQKPLLYGSLIPASIILFGLTKTPYTILLLPFIFLPANKFKHRKSAYTWKLIWVVIPLIITGIWLLYTGHITRESIAWYSQANVASQLVYLKHHLLSFIPILFRTFYYYCDNIFGTMIGWVGNESVGLPLTIISGLFFAIISIAVLLEKLQVNFHKVNKLNKSMLPLTAAGLIVAVSMSLYLVDSSTGARIINGIQGRYFIPILPIILTLIIPAYYFIDIDKANVEKTKLKLVVAESVLISTFLFLTTAVYILANY